MDVHHFKPKFKPTMSTNIYLGILISTPKKIKDHAHVIGSNACSIVYVHSRNVCAIVSIFSYYFSPFPNVYHAPPSGDINDIRRIENWVWVLGSLTC